MLTTLIWFHQRFDRWPTTREMSRMKSYANPDRGEAVPWLREMGYVIKEKTATGTIHRVTHDGREFVKTPSLAMQYPEMPVPLPDDENEQWIVNWVINFCSRHGRWPTPWHYRQCGLYQQDTPLFWETLENLVNIGLLVRIQIRRGRRQVTRLVDTTYCPHLKGCDGFIYYWSTADGPFPEP